MIDWVKTVIEAIGYPGIAMLMIIENIFPPIPSEIIMPFAGFVSEEGGLNVWGIIIAGTLGSVLGTTPYYFLGYKIGEDRLALWVDKHGKWLFIRNDDIKRAQSWFVRHEAMAVLFGRVVPGIRTLISIPAGLNRMNFITFTLLSLLGTSVWVSILTLLGRELGRNYDKVETYLGPVSYIVIGVLALAYIVYVVRR